MAKSISTKVRDQELTLFGRKAIYWHEKKTLIVADTHWGKAEVFQRAGIPVPSTVLDSDLADVTNLVKESGADRLLVLGDLLHSSKTLPAEVQKRLEDWRFGTDLPILSIRGNHDARASDFPQHWQIEWMNEPLIEGPFCFRHEPIETKGFFTWAGHVHPVIHLGRPRMRLPCYLLSETIGIMPSFGTFTGGHPVKPTMKDDVYVVAEGEVFCLTS